MKKNQYKNIDLLSAMSTSMGSKDPSASDHDYLHEDSIFSLPKPLGASNVPHVPKSLVCEAPGINTVLKKCIE